MRTLLLTTAALALATPAHADPADPSVTAEAAEANAAGYQAEAGVASTYIYRGIQQYASRGTPSSQTTAAFHVDGVGPGTLAFSLWSAVALGDFGHQPGNAVELDANVTYAVTRGAVTYTAGYLGYYFPNHLAGAPPDAAHEAIVGASYATPYVTPSVTAFVEIARQQGAYVIAAVTRDLEVAAHVTISPTLSVAGATYRHYLGGAQAASPHVNDVAAQLAAKVELPGGAYLTARAVYGFRGTPQTLAPELMSDGFGAGGRSTLFGLVALGVAR